MIFSMGKYDNFSREELIRRIEELERQSMGQDKSDPPFRERYAYKILDSLPDMLTVLDRNGTMIEVVSSEATNHVGISSADIRGQDIRTVLSPEACRNVKNNLDNVFASGVASSSQHDITLDGETHNYENRILPLDDRHALCICRDITDTENAKHELEMVKYALNNVDEEIYACDIDGTMEYANEQFCLHYDIRDNLSLHKVYEFWAFMGTRPEWEERLEKIRNDNGQHRYTVRFKDTDGSNVAWDVVAYIIYDHFKERDIVWFFGRNVTERIENENKVKEMNTILGSVLNNIPVYLFVKDSGNDFRYLYWNRAFEEFSHIPSSKVIGRTDREVFPCPQDAEKFHRDDLQLLSTGEVLTREEEYVAGTGETRIVTTTKSLVHFDDRPPLIIGVSWDITDQKNTEMEMIAARIRAEESDKLKSAFLANMSHEIRTPLNAIIGFAKLIGMAEADEEKQQYAEIIDTNSDLLLQLINDILDLSKIEAGTLEFRFKEMNLNELCRSEYEVHKGRLKPGVTLVFEERQPNVQIVCDQNRLAQVITNLLNNAAKFTEKGEIRYGFDLRDGLVEFYVEDTGMGISQDKLNDIFDRFVKLNDFVAGTGLGLAITKMIIEKLGGDIRVESEPGHGTRFLFTIPIEHTEECAVVDAPRIQNTEEEADWKLLIAEGTDTCYKFIEAALGRRFALTRAYSGAEAVELFDKIRPDAVLLDINLPIMDSAATVSRIRSLMPGVPIIALSDHSDDNAAAVAQTAGCNKLLIKPVSYFSLNKALNSCLVEGLKRS